MNEPKEEINETSPKHKKHVHIFAGALTAAIALSFIILAFKSGGGGGNSTSKDRAPEETVVSTYSPGVEDFNKRVEQEVKRREQMQKAQNASEPPRRVGQQSQTEQGSDGQTGVVDEKSIEEQFQDQERQRALRSRVSKSKWLSGMARSTGASPVYASLETPMDGQFEESRSNIDQEQKQVDQMIEQLENQLQSQGEKSVPLSQGLFSKKEQPEGTASVVGRPKSEAVPAPGHRLIPTGTVISCVLDQYTMSDYMGSYRAVVVNDVYDVTGNYVLIPKGSKLTGRTVRISNINEVIQARMGMPATWIVLPDGKRISLEKAVTLDQAGIPAVKDKVNYHLLVQFLGVAAYAMISHETSREGSGYSQDRTFEGDMGEAFRSQFSPLIQKYLNLVPTITLAPGTPLKLFIEDDIYARPWRGVYDVFISKQ